MAYRRKITEKPSEPLTKQLEQLERDLDGFDIILIRQKVENEVFEHVVYGVVALRKNYATFVSFIYRRSKGKEDLTPNKERVKKPAVAGSAVGFRPRVKPARATAKIKI